MQYRTIQKGTVSFAAGDTSKVVTLGTAVTMNKAALFFSVRIAQTNANQSAIRGQLTSTTQITFTRNTSGTAAEIEYALVEVASGWTVQRGSVTIAAAATSTTATLTSVNTGRTFHLTSLSSTRANIWSSHVYTRSVLTNATTLTFTRVGSTDAVTIEWQAITFDADSDGTVQRGQSTLNIGVSSVAPTLSTAVSLSRSFARVNSSFSAAGAQVDRAGLQANLTGTTTLTLTRGIASSDTVLAEWEVIELGTNQVVRNVEVALADTDGNDDDTLSAVVTADSFVVIPHFGRFGRGSTTSGDVSNMSLTSALTSTTNLNTQRAATTGSATASVYVIELEPEPAGPSITTQPTAQTAIISNGGTAEFAFDCAGAILSALWELETGIGTGIYATITNGVGGWAIATDLGAGSGTATLTATDDALSGRRVRVTPTDANGSTVSNAVALTVKFGPVLSVTSGALDGSGEIDSSLTCDVVTGTGQFIRLRGIKGGVTIYGSAVTT